MKEEILKIIDSHYPEIAVMLIKNLLQEEDSIKIGKIMKILNVFETGTLEQDYSSVFVMEDGPNGINQVTLGKGLTEFGNLPELIENYVNANGSYSDQLRKYVGRVGRKPSLENDGIFKSYLNKAGDDPVMREEQDKIFAAKYWEPAKKFFEKNGFTKNLSMLVLADSYLHSGSIMSFLRKRFSEKVPADGGSEKEWIEQYVKVRHEWLYSKGGLLRNTIYRTQCFKDQIKKDNWDLIGDMNANGIIVK